MKSGLFLKSRWMTVLKANLFVNGFLLSSALFFSSCRDVFERNLEKNSVSVQAPSENYKSTVYAVNFWWEEVKGATAYRLQIATPDFSNISQLVLDTVLLSGQFTYTFRPGSYCWRVRAENNSSATVYATRCLGIDSTPDLSVQQLALASPLNNFITTQSDITFKWYPLMNSDDYRFELRTPDFNGSLVLNSLILTDTFVVISGLAENSYEWGVRGQNTFSNTAFSMRKFIVDATAPALPVLVLPNSNDTLNGSAMNFTWTQTTDSGSSVYDSLWIYSDTINRVVKKEFYVSYAVQNQIVDTLSPGAYFWGMRAMDAAGNKSGYTLLRKFIVK